MMKNGLLHSTPKNVSEKYPDLLELIEICAESSPELNRFKSSKKLIEIFELILEDDSLQDKWIDFLKIMYTIWKLVKQK